MKISERIKALREASGLTLEEVGKRIGASRQTIYKYENGIITNIPSNNIEGLANLFDVSPAYIMGWTDYYHGNTNPKQMYRRISVYSKIPAGVPIEAIDTVVDFEDISFKDEIFNIDKDYLGLVVSGDSMYPKYLEGDVIIVEINPQPESGEDCVVYINGYEATLKRVIINENSITLQPLNTAYPPVTYAEGDDPVTILGRVVQIRRDV